MALLRAGGTGPGGHRRRDPRRAAHLCGGAHPADRAGRAARLPGRHACRHGRRAGHLAGAGRSGRRGGAVADPPDRRDDPARPAARRAARPTGRRRVRVLRPRLVVPGRRCHPRRRRPRAAVHGPGGAGRGLRPARAHRHAARPGRRRQAMGTAVRLPPAPAQHPRCDRRRRVAGSTPRRATAGGAVRCGDDGGRHRRGVAAVLPRRSGHQQRPALHHRQHRTVGAAGAGRPRPSHPAVGPARAGGARHRDGTVGVAPRPVGGDGAARRRRPHRAGPGHQQVLRRRGRGRRGALGRPRIPIRTAVVDRDRLPRAVHHPLGADARHRARLADAALRPGVRGAAVHPGEGHCFQRPFRSRM